MSCLREFSWLTDRGQNPRGRMGGVFTHCEGLMLLVVRMLSNDEWPVSATVAALRCLGNDAPQTATGRPALTGGYLSTAAATTSIHPASYVAD